MGNGWSGGRLNAFPERLVKQVQPALKIEIRHGSDFLMGRNWLTFIFSGFQQYRAPERLHLTKMSVPGRGHVVFEKRVQSLITSHLAVKNIDQIVDLVFGDGGMQRLPDSNTLAHDINIHIKCIF